MTTQVVMSWLINPYAQALATIANLADAANVPLEPSYFTLTSTTLVSDVTGVVGGQVQRAVTVDLTQPPLQIAPGNVIATTQFTPSIVSTSPKDVYATGTGAQVVQLAYNDAAGAPHTENINLNGTTPVSAVGTNYFRLTGFTIIAAGADLANDGILYISAPTAAMLGGNANNAPGTTILALVDASFYVKFSGGLTTWPAVFKNWLGSALRQAIGPVVEQAPVFT